MSNKGRIDISKVILGSDKFVLMADAVTQSADKLVGALNEAQKTSTTNIKIKADYEDLEKANKILEEMEAARKSPRLIDVATIDNNGNEIYQKASNPQHISNVSLASNYYKSIDTAKNAMAEQWNKLVGYMENNPAVNLESMINSKQSLSTSVLRYANAFEALGGDISSVSEELATFVSLMRNLDELSASKGFSFTVDNFKNIFSYLDRLRDEAGAVFSDFNIKDNLHIDFRSMPETAFGTNTSANEGAREAEKAAERTEEAAEKTKEAAKKYAEATREVMEARLNAQHKKQDADEWDIWGFDAGTDHSLKDLLAKLKELQEQKDSVLYSLTDLNNRLAKGETEDWAGVSLEDRLNSDIEDYHKYVDQIEYVQNALNDAALNFTPGAEWGEEEIGTTILLFLTLLQYAGEVKESLASIKSPDEFLVLITSIEAVSERLSDLASSFHSAFDSFDDNGELISITNYFDQLIQNISELSLAMSKLDMSFNVKFGSTSQSKSPMELADERRREQEAIYDQLLQERSEIEARIYGRYKSALSPTQMIMSLFGNRKTPGLQNYTEWSSFAEEYSSSAIEAQFKKSMSGANSSLRRYIQKIISGAEIAGIDVSDIVKKYEPKEDESLKLNAQQAQELAKSEEDAANSALKMQEALSLLLLTTNIQPILDLLDALLQKLQTIIDIYREYTGIAETPSLIDDATTDTATNTADIVKDKTNSAVSTSDKSNPVNQELELKNDLLTQEAQIVDSLVQGEVEAFEAIEFAIKAIVDLLNLLVAILPLASFDDFVGQDSQTKIAALLKDLEGLTRTLDTIDDQDVFSHLNNLLQSPSQEIGSNIDTITTKFKDLRTVMNGFDDNGSAVFKSLSDLANAGDAIVEKMLKLFSDSGVKLPTTTATQSKQKDVTAASNLMSTQRAEILDAVDNYVSQLPDNLEVVATKMQAGANGIVKVIATVKLALEDGSIAFKEFTFNASDTGDGLNVLLSGTKEGGTTLERLALAYQKFKEAISDSGDELKTLGDVIGGEVFTQDSAGWPQLIELAREFGMELEDIDKITRKVQNGFESFTFLTKDGVSKTLGFSSDRVLMLTDPVLDRKADEKALKEAELAARQRAEQQAKISAEQARIRAEEQKKIQDEYETQMATIDALGKANSDVLFAKADLINGKQNAELMAEAMEHLSKASDDALNALQKIHEMWDAGQISAELYYAAYEKYNSDAILKGSAKSQDAVTQAEFKLIAAAVDELTKSYERLADAENKAANGSTAAVREKGATTALQILARQKELEELIADKTTKEQDTRIEAARNYYARLLSAYESLNINSPSKDLGFGPDSNVEKTWDTLIAKAQLYLNILNKQDNLHKSLTVNEAAFLNNFADLYDEAGQKAEDAGEKGQKFSEAMEAARSNIRTTTIDNFANIIGNLGATDESMPKAYNDLVVELQANLEKLKNTDFGSSQWGQTIEALSSGLEKLNTDPFMQKASDLSKQTLNRLMSDWINNNSGAGEYLEQVRALLNALSSAASQGDLDNIAAGFEKIKSSAAEAGKTGESFGEGLMKRFKSLGQYLLSFASFYRVIDVFKQAIGVVKELDTALVELKKVSDESTLSYSNFMKNSFDMADDVGTTAQSIISSTADWKRLGESFEEALKSATTSTVLLNVSEFTNIEDATQSLVSASQAYKDLDKMDIVDKLNNIGNNFSVSTDELATGLKNAAAVLATQGNDIDLALALLTAGNAVTLDISKTSAGIRTISLRIAGTEEAKNELADMGEDIDDFVVKTRSKTNSIIQDYTAVASNNYKGVSVLDDNGNLRDTYNILLDIAKVYEEIQAEDKKAGTNRALALIEELAGKNRSNIAASILMNPEMLEDVYNASQRSQGSAQHELDTYLNSIEAKYAQLQNRLQLLAYTAIDADAIKVLLDGLSGAVTLATKLVDVLGTIPSILGVVSAIFMQKSGLGFFNFDKNAAKKFTLGLLDVWERAATSIKLPDKEMVKIFGLMDLSKAYVPQLIKLEEQGAIIPSLMWNVDGIENFDEQLTSAREAMTAFGEVSTGVGGLLSNLGNIAGTVGATLLNAFGSAIVMTLVSFAITGVGKVIDSVIHAKENAILLAKETLEEIDTITSENEAREQFQNSDKYERAIELSSKIAVNKDGYKNISATNDEYQEYISLCNEIAGIYPEVVSSYDELGNAIINLGSNAEEAKTKLDELNKASAIAEGFKLKGTSNDTWRGNRVQISDILRERDEALAELDNLKTTKDVFSNDTANNLRELLQSLEENGFVNIDIGALSGQDYELLEKSIRDVADNLNMDLFISPTSGTNGTLDLMLMSPVKEADTWTLFYSTVAASVPEAASEASLAILEASGKVESANNEANNILHELLENSWLELSHSVSYMLLVSGDSILEEAIKNGIFSISLEDVQDVDDIQGWIETNYLKPITQAFVMDKGSAAQDAINNLFTLDTSKLSATKYDQALKDNLSIVEEFYKSIGQEELYESFLINYDFAFKTPNGQIIKNDKDAVYREIQDYLQDETLTDESKAELDSLTWDQLISVEDLVKDGSFSGKLSDAIKKVVNKASQKATPTDTLKTLLSDETFKSDVDYANYEGNLSSLTSALETLRTEGSLTAETMVSLLKSMPSLTDFTEGSLKDAAFQQLDSWIQRIRKGMSTMSEEGKEQTRTMIQNMIDQYGDLGLTLEDIYDEYWQVQGVDKNTTAGYEQIKGQKQFFDAQVDELRSRLAAEGKELDTHVLYTLIASDQFSGTADEIYNAYNDAEVLWHLIADNTELEKQVQRAQLFLAGEDSKISLKEAKGETVTPRDYNFSRLYASQIMNGLYAEAENAKKARDAIDKDVDPETWNTNNISYVNALAAAMDAEAKAALIEKAQIDSSLNEYRNAVADADNAVTKALVAIDDAEAKVGEGMADQSLYDALAEALLLRSVANMDLSEAQKDLFDQYIDTHPEWAKEWLNDSFSSYSSAQSDNREADAQSNKLYQKNLNLLNEDATRTQRELTIAEQNHLKASASTYRDLISNGRAQIENLRAQLHEVENDITAWRSYLDLIESMEDSIYDWSKTMDQLVVTLASELASTLSSAMSEQFSDTGLTSDTMDALLTAFSDLTGNNLDISDVFYNTADGIKVNTLAIEELTEAEFDLQSAQLQLQIDMVLEALERNPGNSALNQKLQLLMQTLALYFAQYEEMRKALSYNGAMSLAELTTNLGANFDSNINRYSTYAEAYKKGYVGTDDFEAWTAYLDVYGRTGKDIYEGVKDKAERYFGLKKDDSADEIAGLQNFLNDLEKLGYATKSETTPGGYDLKFDSYENASKAMGMGQEWFEDMLGKLEERGFDIMSVSSLTDSALLMQDLEAQRKLALATYMDMRDRGASKEDLSSQLELVDELGTKMLRLSTLTEDWLQTTEDARKMNFANLQSNLAELERLASETEDEATKNLYREEAAKEAAEFGYTLKEGGFSLSEADAADYASRFVGGTLLSPLSAAQMGYGPEVADKYVAMINKVSEAYLDEDSNVLSLVDTLNGYDKDKLWDIDHADGKWSDGEKEVELLCDALGVGYDNAKLLIDALAGLGLIKTPDSITSLPDTFAESKQQLDGLLATARKGSGAAYQIDTSDDYTGKTLDLLRTQLSEVRQMLADTVWDETNLGAKDYLEQLDRNVTARIEIETVLSEGDTTLKLLLDMSDEELAAKFNVDVDSDEFTALKLLLELLLNSYDLEIHIDDTLFDQLMTALVGEDWETTVNVKADTEEYEETVSSLEPPDGTNTGEQGPDSTPSNPVLNATQSGQNAVSNFLTGNNVTTTESETGYTGFTEELDLTEQTAENVSVNAQNVLVNDDTNTPGSIAKGESLTSEQRLEYSSASEATESEEEGVIETSTAVINADAAEVNSELPNETETNYQSPVEESSYQFMNPSNPFEYGLPQPLQYLESWQPPIPTSTPMESAVPGEVSTGNMSVTAGSVTVSGPVTTLNTQTETPTPSFTTAPTVVPTTESANANVSVDADTSAIETVTSALDEITDKTVTITVNEEGVSATSAALTAIYTTAGLVDGQSPTITVKEDGVSATSASLTAIYNTAQQVEGIDPNVIVNATDNASGKLENVISAAQTAGSQTPNVTVTESGSVNAVAKLNSVRSAAEQADAKDPSITVSLNTGNTIGVLQSIRNTINSLPPSKTITITTVKREVLASGTFARGTFHPAHALGTVYGYANGTIGKYWDEYSRLNSLGAYAGGRNVALGHDQQALVNEVGVESIVYYVRTCTVMCMLLFIKLLGHPKANQATT